MTLDFTPYRVIVPLIACFIVIYAWSHALRGTKTIWEACLWTFFWGAIAVIVLFPSWISLLTTWTGIRDQANAVFAIAIGILLFMVFHIIVRLEKMEKRITDIVRQEALEEAGLIEDKGQRMKGKGTLETP